MVSETLAHYRIVEKLGQGGMGEVYVAEDTKLDRRVALKVLPPELADPQHLARFEREAKAVAALNHPNIVTLHSVEEADGVRFLTMELVEGETLTRSIREGGLPLARFFDIAVAVADALRAAHERGITHRDLKPGNIMLDREGRVKVLDFGLVKLLEGESSPQRREAPTEALTEEGSILGTVPYMSPEQVQGKTVDHRSDIFSLGVVLYEMATGRRPFEGETSADLMSSILRDTPESVTQLSADYPRHVGRIVKRCLEKDPSRRYQSTLEVRNELENLREEVDSGEVVSESARAAALAAPRSRRWWPVALAVVTLVVLAAVYGLLRPAEETGATAPPLQATFSQLTRQAGLEVQPSLSPDGKFLVYASDATGNWDIYLQRIGGQNPISLTAGSEEDDLHPAYSPDGDLIAFRSERDGGGIFLMGATGESVRRLTESGYNPTWSPDGGEILFATEGVGENPLSRTGVSELWVVEVASGETRSIFKGDAVQPSWSPRGHRVAYWGLPPDGGQRDIWTVRSDGGDPVPVTDDPPLDWSPVWSPDGRYLCFSSDRGGSLNLWRIAIDEESGEVLGEPEPLTTPSKWSGQLSVSQDGQRIVFTALERGSNIKRVPFDPMAESVAGAAESVTRSTAPVDSEVLSPDGQWLAYRSSGRQEDLFVVRSDGSDPRRLTDDLHKDRGPSWSPDGERIVFYSDRSGRYELWTIRPDGSGLQQLTDTTGRPFWYPKWSPDGSRIAVANEQGTFLFDLSQPPPLSTPEPLPPLGEDEVFQAWAWSPEGRRLAGYVGNPAGGYLPGLVVYSLDSGEYDRLADLRGGYNNGWGVTPAWLSDGRRLLGGARGGLFLVDSQSKKVRQILEAPPGTVLAVPRLSEGDRTLYFQRLTLEADIWLATMQ
jgi:Tol biopolymer transport system component